MAPKQTPDMEPVGPVFLTSLRAALGRVPLWTLTALSTLLLAFCAALPWHSWFSQAVPHSYAPGSQLHHLDVNFRTDHAAALAQLDRSSSALMSVLALAAMLMAVFFAGGWLQVFLERTEGHSVRRFFFGGARYFGRFLRVLLLTLVGASLLDWAFHGPLWERHVLAGLSGVEGGKLETLELETTLVQLGWLQGGAYLLGLAFLFTWADYTRTRLALYGTSSAFLAGAGALFFILRHPFRTLRPMLALTAIELAVLALLGLGLGRLQGGLHAGSELSSVVLVGSLPLLAVLCGKLLRGARYAVAVHVSRQFVSPLEGPNPWSQTIGGPGGPQYPIVGDDDGHGVSF